ALSGVTRCSCPAESISTSVPSSASPLASTPVLSSGGKSSISLTTHSTATGPIRSVMRWTPTILAPMPTAPASCTQPALTLRAACSLASPSPSTPPPPPRGGAKKSRRPPFFFAAFFPGHFARAWSTLRPHEPPNLYRVFTRNRCGHLHRQFVVGR